MPSLGADMEAGKLVEWLVKPGDRVKRGDIVAVVETQKGAIEIEIFEAGQISDILVELNENVPVGTPLALIQTESEAQAGSVTATSPARPTVTPAAMATLLSPLVRAAPGLPPSPPLPMPGASRGLRVRASPAARLLADANGIDLPAIAGSGPAGAITYRDVEQHIGEIAAVEKKKRAIGLDLEAMRSAIAAAMARSKREIPHYYLEHQIDVTACEQWLPHQRCAPTR